MSRVISFQQHQPEENMLQTSKRITHTLLPSLLIGIALIIFMLKPSSNGFSVAIKIAAGAYTLGQALVLIRQKNLSGSSY
jgi:hypothetical protein